MTNDENKTARQIIEKLMPMAIWLTALMIIPYYYWIDEKNTLQQSLLNISTAIPLFLLLSTFIIEVGGLCMHGFMLGLAAIQNFKSMMLANALEPIVSLVAAVFITDKRDDISETTSDDELMRVMKEFGKKKSVKISTKRVKKTAQKFLDEIGRNVGSEHYVVELKDLLERDIFTTEVLKHIKDDLFIKIDDITTDD